MSTPEQLKFIIPPRDNWYEGFSPLVAHLSDALSLPVSLSVANDYSDLIEQVNSGAADLGVFTSTAYAQVRKMDPGVTYLVTGETLDNGKKRAFYFGYLIAHRDTQLSDIRSFENQTIGFVSQTSSSGYKFPRAFLVSKGVVPEVFFRRVEYIGSHEKVTDGIANKKIDLGATWDVSLEEAVRQHGDIFAKVAQYGPITNHAIAARHNLDSELVNKITDALLSLPEVVLNEPNFPYVGFTQVPSKAYDPAEDVIALEEVGEPSPIIRSLSLEEFRRLSLNKVLGLIREVRIQEASNVGDFVFREPTELIRYLTISEYKDEISRQLQDVSHSFSRLKSFTQNVSQLLNEIVDASSNAQQLVSTHRKLLEIEDQWLDRSSPEEIDRFSIRADKSRVYLYVVDRNLPLNSLFRQALQEDITDLEFLAQASSLAEELRDNQRNPSQDERMILEIAYTLLGKGRFVPSAYQDLGISGFREFQTYLFNTDPGEGHISVTCCDRTLMRGAAVHIEHIDRDQEADKSKVEPYRLPAPINAAKVRLNVGSHAPCTAFIGRPVFEGDFRFGLLKSVHMTASACNTMFRNGIADCKIGIENMTATESIEFMKGVVGNVLREPERQFLAAAFNINTPIIDDRGTETKEISDRLAIGMLGIEIARLGEFDKVTWDGASNEIPSRPILGQLDFSEIVALVHRAHEFGLNCYISAGLKAHHMREAVYAGLDGVGIGTSLHFFDPEVGMGALKPDAIREILSVRDQAMQETLGQGAALLARLDRLYFEGTLMENVDSDRNRLFDAIKNQDEEMARRLLLELEEIRNLPEDQESPPIAQARRLVTTVDGHQTILAKQTSRKFYDDLVENLKYCMATNDTQGVVKIINEVNQTRHKV
ncbi:MAG: PhnD/SsuA/transferrin family substrate-binding protein [Crocosphaera sp.]|nr:PhnD/SsuA/transferrin family substrate-binding protein [Crocosphaera sp.]